MPFMIPILGAIGSALATVGSAIATPFEALGIAAANTGIPGAIGGALSGIGGGSALAGASTLGGLASTGMNIANQVSQPSLSDVIGQLNQGQPAAPTGTPQAPAQGATQATPAPLGQQQQQQFLANTANQFATTQGQTSGSLSPGYYDQLANQIFSQTYGTGVPNQNDLVNQAVNQFFGQGG